jgi:hypothetical protein
MLEISYHFEVEVLHKNMQLEVIKVIKPSLNFLKYFYTHNYNHVGFMFQGFVYRGKLSGTCKCNLVGI